MAPEMGKMISTPNSVRKTKKNHILVETLIHYKKHGRHMPGMLRPQQRNVLKKANTHHQEWDKNCKSYSSS